jgi:periodic tryptophan protein 1
MISTLLWLKKGSCAEEPRKANVTEQDLQRVEEITGLRFGKEEQDNLENQFLATSAEGISKEELVDGDDECMQDVEQEDESNSDSDADSENDKGDDDMDIQENPNDLSEYNLDGYDEEPGGAVERKNMLYFYNIVYFHLLMHGLFY